MKTNTNSELAAQGYIANGKVYRNAFLQQPAKEIGLVKESDDAALAYFSKRFETLTAKVHALLAEMEAAENKGSYLNKIVHEKLALADANAIGDFLPLHTLLAEKEAELRSSISSNRKKNTEIKRQLVADLEALHDPEDYKEQAVRLREIRLSWIKTGPMLEDVEEEITKQYNKLSNFYFEQRKVYLEQRQVVMDERVAMVDNIIERQRELNAPDVHPGHIIKTLQQLALEWREVGQLPKEAYESRKAEFKDNKRELMRLIKRILKNKPAGPKAAPRPLTPEEIEQLKNFDIKKDQLVAAKALLDSGDFRGAYPKVKEMQAAWHSIGPIPKSKTYINKDFIYICDRISEFSYLNKMLYQSNNYYFKLSSRDLIQAKINIMKDIIRKEDTDIEAFDKQLDEMITSSPDPESQEIRALRGRINSQFRRLTVKKEILNELKTEYSEMLSSPY